MSIIACALQSTWSSARWWLAAFPRPALRGLDPPCRGQQAASLFLLTAQREHSTQQHTKHSTAPHHPHKSCRSFASCGASSLEAYTQALRLPLVTPHPNCPQPPRYFLAVIRLCSSIYSSFCHPAPEPQPSPCLINH
jgi:hypothetical protein